MIVNVAVASYNHFPYIKECIDSIADQKGVIMDLSWIDDCSMDESYNLAADYVSSSKIRERFRNITMRRNSINRGAAYSLNLAARLSNAPYISFMNSDDAYGIDRLQKLIELMQRKDAQFAFSNVMPLDENGHSMVSDKVGQHIAFDAELLISKFGSISAAFLSRQIASSTGNFLVTADIFEKVGGFEDLKYCHDWMFALQCSLLSEPVFHQDRLYKYRLHSSNSFKSLGHVAEAETDEVLEHYYSKLAIELPPNRRVACPQRQPAAFWALAASTHTSHVAHRVFFPYSAGSRLLGSRAKRGLQ